MYTLASSYKQEPWSSSILTAKSRLMFMSVPRNELHALLIAAELAYAVVGSLQLPIQEVTLLTDSLVSLCWVSNYRARNKVCSEQSIDNQPLSKMD